MTSFFEHQRISFKRNYLRNLISLASTDGDFDAEERNLIMAIGMRRGLKEWQINELLEDTTRHVFFVPDSIGNRMNLLYDIMQIVYADGIVTTTEINFVKNILGSLDLEQEVMGDILGLFDKGTPTILEWNDFMETVVDERSKRFMTIL